MRMSSGKDQINALSYFLRRENSMAWPVKFKYQGGSAMISTVQEFEPKKSDPSVSFGRQPSSPV
jgi:hypothetical protein